MSLRALPKTTATKYVDLPLAERDHAWDGPAAKASVARWASSDGSGDKDKIDWVKYAKAFFWSDPEAKDQLGGYKLVFADVVKGELKAIFRGVGAVAGVLNGARGGVDIPDADVPAVKAHVKRYYEKASKQYDDPEIKAPWDAVPASGRKAELLIYDTIGDDWGGGISAAAFAGALFALGLQPGDELTLRVNSPGGSTFDGLAIYNSLLACPAHKIAKVEGLAASAASFVIQACNEVQVAETAFVMIHRAWTFAIGDADDMLKTAALLEQNDAVIAGVYARRSGLPPAQFRAAMEAETWYVGQEAVDAGLADGVIASGASETPAATYDERIFARFRRAPAALQRRVAASLRPRLAPAALLVPRSEGKVLASDIEEKLQCATADLQYCLDRHAGKPASDGDGMDPEPDGDEPVKAKTTLEPMAATIQLLRSELERAHARIDTLTAVVGR